MVKSYLIYIGNHIVDSYDWYWYDSDESKFWECKELNLVVLNLGAQLLGEKENGLEKLEKSLSI